MIEDRKAAGVAAEHLAEDGEIFGLALAAEPLDFVFVAMGAKAEQRGDARVEPADRIRKIHGAERTNFVAFAEGNLAAAGAGAAVEREDQRAIEIRGVVGAGGVRQVMLEVLELYAVEMFAEFTEARGLAGIFCGAAFARGAELRAEAGFAEAGFLGKIG